jgi:RNA polymerase sigma-70 factor (ECF subfamily)
MLSNLDIHTNDMLGETDVDYQQIWLEAALEGDQEAFGKLVETYETQVYNLAYRMLGDSFEAEDAAIETFLRAYRKLHLYDPRRKFSSWLLSIASHYCIDQLRRRRILWFSLEDERIPQGILNSHQPGPEHNVIQQERENEIQELLDKLPAKDRAAIVLHYWYELSYEEIAETTGDSVSAVKSRLFRARRKLAHHASVDEALSQTVGYLSSSQQAV